MNYQKYEEKAHELRNIILDMRGCFHKETVLK